MACKGEFCRTRRRRPRAVPALLGAALILQGCCCVGGGTKGDTVGECDIVGRQQRLTQRSVAELTASAERLRKTVGELEQRGGDAGVLQGFRDAIAGIDETVRSLGIKKTYLDLRAEECGKMGK